MNLPGILLTGASAGSWYVNTLHRLHGEAMQQENPFEHWALQTDFAPINELLPYQMNSAAVLLEPYVRKMETTTSQPYILANITLHEAIRDFQDPPRQLLHIERILQEQCAGLTGRVGVLGTSFTMQHSYIPSIIPHLQTEPLPSLAIAEIDALRRFYYTKPAPELAKAVFSKIQTIQADYWIIACTELAMAYEDAAIPLPLIHLPELQCRYLLRHVANSKR